MGPICSEKIESYESHHQKHPQRHRPATRRTRERGQVVVEYVLLLVILVSIATALVRGLVGQGGNSGSVIVAWVGIMREIAKDMPEEPTP